MPRQAIVVSHPDDEVIWSGGLALRLKCDIICCSIPARDPIRALKFYDACEVLGCRGIVIPYVEQPPKPLDLSMLDLSKYDEIITHNQVGEYGHAHHVQLHNHIKEKYGSKVVGYFGYNMPEAKNIKLTNDEYQQKLKALQCYDHNNGIDGEPKWSALIKRYNLDLAEEMHVKS